MVKSDMCMGGANICLKQMNTNALNFIMDLLIVTIFDVAFELC